MEQLTSRQILAIRRRIAENVLLLFKLHAVQCLPDDALKAVLRARTKDIECVCALDMEWLYQNLEQHTSVFDSFLAKVDMSADEFVLVFREMEIIEEEEGHVPVQWVNYQTSMVICLETMPVELPRKALRSLVDQLHARSHYHDNIYIY